MPKMLYMVEMVVRLPPSIAAKELEELKLRERETSERLQVAGTWKHLWRVAGAYANVSIFDVEGPEQLHDVLVSLPFFPFLTTRVVPLIRHPSSIIETTTTPGNPA